MSPPTLRILGGCGGDGRFAQSCRRRCEHGTSPKRGLWLGPVFSVSMGLGCHRTRERVLAVNAAAIMTRTAATAMAMIQRTQSMPGLPLPPSAV